MNLRVGALALVANLALVGSATLGLASPAAAAALGTLTVTAPGSVLTASQSTYTSISVGDTLIIDNQSGHNLDIASSNAFTFNFSLGATNCGSTPCSISTGGQGTLTVTQLNSGVTGTLDLQIVISGPQHAYVTFVGVGGGGSSSSSSSGPGPAPVVQEFGKPSSDTCDAAQPEGLNWAGVSSGGWSESWAQWMNGGTGGFVCTRTLVYSNNLSHWVVG